MKKRTSDMGPGFLNRVFRTSMGLSLGLSVIVGFYFGWRSGLDFGFSAAWGTFGFLALRGVLVEATRPAGPRWNVLGPAVLLKVALYAAGLAYLMLARPGTIAVLTGISLVLIIIVLKVLSRLLIESDWFRRPLGDGGRR